MKNLYQKLLSSRLVVFLLNFIKSWKLKNSDVSVYDIMMLLYKKLNRDNIMQYANAIAFNFTLAIFPGIIFLFTLIPYIPVPDLNIKIMDLLEEFFPPYIFQTLESTILDIVNKPRGGLLSFGFLFTLYLASNGTSSMMEAFNSCYRSHDKRNIIKRQGIAIGITILLAFILFTAVIVLIVGNLVINYLVENTQYIGYFQYYIITGLRYLLIIAIFYAGISMIYYIAPAIHRRWKFFSKGSFLATLLSILVTVIFSYYINNFANYNKFYGSIGAIIGLMLWLNFISVIILIGFEFNASVDILKGRNTPKRKIDDAGPGPDATRS